MCVCVCVSMCVHYVHECMGVCAYLHVGIFIFPGV